MKDLDVDGLVSEAGVVLRALVGVKRAETARITGYWVGANMVRLDLHLPDSEETWDEVHIPK